MVSTKLLFDHGLLVASAKVLFDHALLVVGTQEFFAAASTKVFFNDVLPLAQGSTCRATGGQSGDSDGIP